MVRYEYKPNATPLCIVGVLLAILTGCGGGNGSGPSGMSSFNLSGKAYHEIDGGACCHPPVDTPLNSAILSFHTINSSVVVKQVTTDASGSYSVILPNGTYSVDLANRAAEPAYNTVTPRQILITSTTPQQVNLVFVEDVP